MAGFEEKKLNQISAEYENVNYITLLINCGVGHPVVRYIRIHVVHKNIGIKSN